MLIGYSQKCTNPQSTIRNRNVSRRQAGGQGERAFGAIQNIKMVAGCAATEEIADLHERPLKPERFDDFRLVAGGLQPRHQLCWQRRSTERGDAEDLFER